MVIAHHCSSASSTAFPSLSLLDSDLLDLDDAALFCQEEQVVVGVDDDEDCFCSWDEQEEPAKQQEDSSSQQNPLLFPLLLSLPSPDSSTELQLQTLLSKEQEQQQQQQQIHHHNATSRTDAVGWILKVSSYYGFSTLTAILSINYLDRFLSLSPQLQQQQDSKPWLIHLLAVTCLSLAAKVEETDVPLLLDLQMGLGMEMEEDTATKYVFEAKTIQKMELLVLSTLHWKMNPVTPLSFLDHLVNNTHHLHREFYRRCERILISTLADCRSLGYLPSVMAMSTMMHVIHQMEPTTTNPNPNPPPPPHVDYQNQLLGVLNITKEQVKDCYALILDISSYYDFPHCHNKMMMIPANRKRCRDHNDDVADDGLLLCNEPPASPIGVIDAYFGSDSSNESWSSSSSSSSTSSSTFSSHSTKTTTTTTSTSGARWGKKPRVYEQYMRLSSPSTFSSSLTRRHHRMISRDAAAD